MSPLPSSGLPSGSTMRPSSASPTGISSRRPVRLTLSPSSILSHSPKSTAPTLSASRFSARPVTSLGSSSISIDMAFSRPWTRAMPSPIERTVPTSARSAAACSMPSMRSLRILVISSGRICIDAIRSCLSLRGGARDLSAKSFQAAVHAGVEHLVAHTQHDAADDVRVDPAGQLDAPAGLVLNPVSDGPDERVVQLDCAGHLDREHLVLLAPELVERPSYTEGSREPVAFGQQLQEVEEALVASLDDLADRVLLLDRAEARREEEGLQVLVFAQRVRPGRELLLDLVQLAMFHGGLEQRARIDLGDLFHQLLEALPSGANAEKSTSDSASSMRRF